MDCKQLSAVAGCIRHADGTHTPVTIHYEYRDSASGNTQLHATRVSDAEGQPLSLAGTDVLTVGACPVDRVSLFSFERLVGAVGNVVVPVGTRSVTVFNRTSATISVALSGDAQAMPPFSAHNFARDPDNESFFGSPLVASVLGGSVDASEEIIFNFKTVV